MKKVIILGECTLDIIFPAHSKEDSITAEITPGGRLLNAAALLGDKGREVVFMGEIARDFAGDIIISFLERHAVATKSIDRYTGGLTPVNLFQGNDLSTAMCMRRFPEEDFDNIWPRIDPDDIIVFGSYFAISSRVRHRLKEFLDYATDRKAIIIYVPGFLPAQSQHITHEMPIILENLEISDLILTRSSDLLTIFKSSNDTECYRKHLDFYCRAVINFDQDSSALHFFNDKDYCQLPVSGDATSLRTNASVVAGIIDGLLSSSATKSDLDSLDKVMMDRIMENTGKFINAPEIL